LNAPRRHRPQRPSEINDEAGRQERARRERNEWSMRSPITPAVAARIDERVGWLDDEIEAALAAGADLPLYRMACYHLGWRDERLEPVDEAARRRHGGKRLRGVLCLLACEAVGGEGRRAAPAGAAVELIHNFSLVHDDIEDGDAERRHRPTVWKLWGVPHAINVGSSMQAMVNVAALRLAREFPADTTLAALETLTSAIVQMTEGQYLDMAAQDARELSLDGYFQMTGGKTAALVEAALRVGARLGTADPQRIDWLAGFGLAFGLAFQARDDYLGIWGEPARTGKPVGSDILQGKRSLPVVHGLARAAAGSPEGQQLRVALRERDVIAVLAALEQTGTRDFVRTSVDHHTQAALRALAAAQVTGPSAEAIRAIAEFALGRES
jgi:geranylgeranyl diphosphate synthase type I